VLWIAMDQHRFDANPDLDRNFHVDADPWIRIPISF
jgi:hypothetical protein